MVETEMLWSVPDMSILLRFVRESRAIEPDQRVLFET